ncbi:MAG TPA: hypothetical protein PLI43_10355, partial [Albidovulum sp.]|uniref:hypothetical protein n=1 Tax=Albidovulum sp. TaxID=1872424 RepID=UPI002BFC8BCE|nr:hypothetical protein [Albidovulum sp.]
MGPILVFRKKKIFYDFLMENNGLAPKVSATAFEEIAKFYAQEVRNTLGHPPLKIAMDRGGGANGFARPYRRCRIAQSVAFTPCFARIAHGVALSLLRLSRLTRPFGGLAKVDRCCFDAADCSDISAIA